MTKCRFCSRHRGLAVDASGCRSRCSFPSFEEELRVEGLCAELVPVPTEDGWVTGRCRLPIDDQELGMCEGHAAEMRSWRSMSEEERSC